MVVTILSKNVSGERMRNIKDETEEYKNSYCKKPDVPEKKGK